MRQENLADQSGGGVGKKHLQIIEFQRICQVDIVFPAKKHQPSSLLITEINLVIADPYSFIARQ